MHAQPAQASTSWGLRPPLQPPPPLPAAGPNPAHLRRGGRQHVANAAHVAAERGQALLQALPIPQVGQHAVKPAQRLLPLLRLLLRLLRLGQEQPGLGHQALQAQRLQRGRLAAGVGARHSNHAHAGRHSQVNRLRQPGPAGCAAAAAAAGVAAAALCLAVSGACVSCLASAAL